MSSKITGPKGAPDLLPPVSALHEQVIEEAVKQFRLWGYQRIETPVFENTALFERGLESGSDIVTKQMYSFWDRGGRSLTLRPDMTAPTVRAILEHGLDRSGLPVKVYYVAPIFRHERPQAGRYRQFTQVGIEAVGSPGPQIDADVIALAMRVYDHLGVGGVRLLLNSIGHPQCRESYMPVLKRFLEEHRDELCEDCRRKIDSNPLRTFDCKVANDREVMSAAPVMSDYLCVDCKQHYESVKDLLELSNIEFIEEPRLVRGLDYYSRTAFEFTSERLGAQDSVGAGGRYDGLAEQLGGPALPGIGFGLGVERIVLALQSEGLRAMPNLDVFVVSVGDQARRAAFTLAAELRNAGISTDLDHDGRPIKGQFKAADRSRATWAIVIGENELKSGSYTVKEMQGGRELAVPKGEVVTHLKASI